MKKTAMLMVLIIISVKLFGIEIFLDGMFHLDPIRGINGNQFEANSKFVQRMIYSPLVFPLEDPYLADSYSVTMDLSIIKSGIGYKTRQEDNNYLEYNYSLSQEGPHRTFFRVELRDNLNFTYIDDKGEIKLDELNAYDVVYSYRLAMITLGRIFNENIVGNNEFAINSLMYSRIRNIKDVYCDNNNKYVYFELNSNISCLDFVHLLVYIPILQFQNILPYNAAHRIYTELRTARFITGNIANTQYNDYDLKQLLNTRARIRNFLEKPRGYGQFIVKGVPSRSSGDRNVDLFSKIELVRNPNWCSFNNGIINLRRSDNINHNVYCNDRLELIIEHKTNINLHSSRIFEELLDKETDRNTVLYNMPITASLFSREQDNLDDLIRISRETLKQKMQISHRLYGIFFGPSPLNNNTPLSTNTRTLFSGLVDRYRLENTLLYTTKNISLQNFHSQITSDIESTVNNTNSRFKLITSDLQMQRLYLPFYVQGSVLNEITDEYNRRENNDEYYSYYRNILRNSTLQDYYLRACRREENEEIIQYSTTTESDRIYYEFIENGIIPPNTLKDLNDLFSSPDVQNDLFNNTGFRRIEILYVENDEVGKKLAEHYVNTLNVYFGEKNIKDYDNSLITNKSITANDAVVAAIWANARNSSRRNGNISLFVYGWNYKFDILDLLNFSVSEQDGKIAIRDLYRELIEGKHPTNDNLKDRPDSLIYRDIADRFTRGMMIPLIGIQNYAVYRSDNTQLHAFGDTRFNDIIMMLPFYWSR